MQAYASLAFLILLAFDTALVTVPKDKSVYWKKLKIMTVVIFLSVWLSSCYLTIYAFLTKYSLDSVN